MSTRTVREADARRCFNFAFQLYQFADHVAWCRSQSENVIEWCRENLGSIVASEVTQIEVQFMKYETKVDLIKRENDIASNEWLITAESRLELLKSREYNVRRKADILIEKGKKKMSDELVKALLNAMTAEQKG